VFLHPYAGVLSAYGMGLADIRALNEEQFDQPLSANTEAERVLQRLGDTVKKEVTEQGVNAENIAIVYRAHLKYAGSHQSLEVDFGTDVQLRERFDAAHQSRFGFTSDGRELVFDMLSVEAIGQTETAVDTAADLAVGKTAPVSVQMIVNDNATDVQLYDRESLPLGDTITGPAIITESTGTTILEPGWSATVDAYGNLILTRHEKKQREFAIGTDADPVMLEVFNNLFMSIAEQMGTTLANTAYSVNIKERLDFSCALFDGNGNLVANAPHVPVHLGSMSESVRTIAALNRDNMKPGNSYMLNAPFNGGTHLPDVTVITPVFNKQGDEILFYVGSRGHHAGI